MNSLVGVGAVTSFSVGALAPLVPQMGFDPSFMEEPVMLLAFVLLGRALETRARLTAAGGCSTPDGLFFGFLCHVFQFLPHMFPYYQISPFLPATAGFLSPTLSRPSFLFPFRHCICSTTLCLLSVL